MMSEFDNSIVLSSRPAEVGWSQVADQVYPRVFRTGFDQPGFGLLQWDSAISSKELRRAMVELKNSLSKIHHRGGQPVLRYLSLGRFDQQNSTKFHLDGGPAVSFLMLGYEPSKVPSEVALADYSRAAFDTGCTPGEYLDRFNPMFQPGEQRLARYISPVREFDPSRSQILLINNSCEPWMPDSYGQQGVLHQGTVPSPNPAHSRIINSTMIGLVSNHEQPEDAQSVEMFLSSERIASSSYNR